MWSLSSETGRLTDVLLCRPDHYRWVPHNAVARRVVESGAPPPGPAQLAAQHGEFADALAGARDDRDLVFESLSVEHRSLLGQTSVC